MQVGPMKNQADANAEEEEEGSPARASRAPTCKARKRDRLVSLTSLRWHAFVFWCASLDLNSPYALFPN